MHIPPPSMDHIRDMMTQLDKNDDDKLSLKEFTPLFMRLLYSEGFLLQNTNILDLEKARALRFDENGSCHHIVDAVKRVMEEKNIQKIEDRAALVKFITDVAYEIYIVKFPIKDIGAILGAVEIDSK